jgi:UDP-glucuronate 4-epimerase
MKLIITGSAGFLGFSLCIKLLKSSYHIIGIDNHNNYYDPKLKEARFNKLIKYSNYQHYRIDLSDQESLEKVFKEHKPEIVINLAAQAGVRYSIENPLAYVDSNVVGFVNILENCRHQNVNHLIYASTSSVYGANTKLPFSEHDSTNHPLSIYAATKKSNELMSHSYSHLYGLPTTGLRFFTVYGPWGRPDMALFKFTKDILDQKPIEVFNNGQHTRDFTYVDDIVNGIIKVLEKPAKPNLQWNSNQPDPATSKAPWRIYNIGNNKPIELMKYINILENALGKKAIINFLPLQPGDISNTYADISALKENFNYAPSTPVAEGVNNFVNWYKEYYKK